MASRVTIQDIADALGISRNTVSKAINNSPGLSPATREKILQKAAELGYKQFSYINMMAKNAISDSDEPQSAPPVREIAFFMEGFQDSSHFAHTMLDKFQRELSQLGYAMTVHHLPSEEIDALRLPATFHPERTSGILVVELFSEPYMRMLCEMNIPLLFVDAPVTEDFTSLPADVLLMENHSGISAFVSHMLKKGKKEIGFIGKARHCRSFFERYLAFRNAMLLHGGTINEDFCLIDNQFQTRYPSAHDYRTYLRESIRSLDHLPDVFICANDFVALDVILVCRELGYSVPDDLMLCGFDDSPESKVITPSLTTVHIHSQIMGLSAVQLLISRINEPNLHFRTVYTETNLIYRDSAPY